MPAYPVRLRIEADLDYHLPQEADVLLAVEAMPTADQRLVSDKLRVTGTGQLRPLPQEDGIGQRTLFRAKGNVGIRYRADIIVDRPVPDLSRLTTIAPHLLTNPVINYLFPSRYCESDKLETFVQDKFGRGGGGAQIAAMAAWVHDNFSYVPGTSDGNTTAIDSFVARRGVCRDYAHVLIAFARAAGIPARMVSTYALHLTPPDFHAIVEVWLADGVDGDGAPVGGWHLVDPTGLAPVETMARIAVGRDATDISFMTIFGAAEMVSQDIRVSQVALDAPAP